ncbi:MAG: YqeG family HAD IIIA-type phosphatase [Armatimonadetes bacterium]|nr:YqeG family HAD IIIA-type phosphatase [Armatimonadota bacterium]
MNSFRPGKFHRDRIPRSIQRFSPTSALSSLQNVDLDDLKAAGKKLILIDVDNTLLPWRAEEIPPDTLEWVNRAKELGFDICILSNTRNPERLTRISGKMGLDFIRAKFKPSTEMYLLALDKYDHSPSHAVMIGDQLLTDIWGANRTGIDAIWVKPIGKREFIGTRVISRKIEWVVGRFLYRYFQADGADAEQRPGFFGRQVVRQFVKFGVVGVLSTVVDWGLHRVLLFVVPGLQEKVGNAVMNTFQPGAQHTAEAIYDAAYGPLKIGPVLLAIFVSYTLNRLFTFDLEDRSASTKQAAQFYAVALIGMVIAVTVSTIVNHLAKGSVESQFWKGSFFGLVAGFLWNFNVQRLWTFKQKG